MQNARLLRRLRRFLPYPLIGAALFWLRPVEPMASDAADQILDLVGLLVAFAGEALRFWTWGANADAGLYRIRANGPYALLRHPLYAGNFLLVCGVLLIYNNPIAYVLAIPAFVVLYNVIARREEHQILQSHDLGPPYAEYIRQCPNRFLPRLSRWPIAMAPAHPFRWQVAWDKEYEAVLGILIGWVVLDFLEEQLVWGGRTYGGVLPYVQVGVLVLVALAAPLLYRMKKKHRPRFVPPDIVEEARAKAGRR